MSFEKPTRGRFDRVDNSSDPGWFVRLLDSTRRLLLSKATANPASFFGYLDLTPGCQVLSVGCGTGDFDRLMAPLVRPGGRVVGVDFSQSMVDVAVSRTAGLDLPLEFRQADVHELPFADAKFDRCLATQVFQHLPGPRRGLEEMVRVARPGGRVVITEPDWDSRVSSIGNLAVARALDRAWADKINNPCIARDLPEMFREAGLVQIQADLAVYRMSDNDESVVLQLLGDPLGELLADGRITQAQHDEALDVIRQRIRSKTFLDATIMFRVTGVKP